MFSFVGFFFQLRESRKYLHLFESHIKRLDEMIAKSTSPAQAKVRFLLSASSSSSFCFSTHLDHSVERGGS